MPLDGILHGGLLHDSTTSNKDKDEDKDKDNDNDYNNGSDYNNDARWLHLKQEITVNEALGQGEVPLHDNSYKYTRTATCYSDSNKVMLI